MANISDKLADEFVEYAIDLQRFSESAVNDIRGFLTQLAQDLEEALKKIDPAGPEMERYRAKRLTELLKTVKKTINKTYTDIGRHVGRELRELAEIEVSAAEKINVAVGYDLIKAGLNKNRLKRLVDGTLIDGAPSSEWWSRQSDSLAQRFADEVRMGMALGEATEQILERLGYKDGKRIKGQRWHYFEKGILGPRIRDARSVVLTSVHAVSQKVRHDMYQDNADVIKGVQALATLDNRTTQICMSRSGNAWTLDGKPLGKTKEDFPGPPPWHWRCRSTLIPLLCSIRELGGRLSPRKLAGLKKSASKRTQSSMDGQVAADLNYEQWLKTKPKEFQVEVLGPKKYELWKNGKLTFRDLVDQKGRPLTVKELQKKYGRK